MSDRLRVGIIGATGMVGQRFVTLLSGHPDFEIRVLAASARSAGKTYGESVEGRWAMGEPLPASLAGMMVQDAARVDLVAPQVDFVFCAVDLSKDETLALEEAYAKAEVPVVSNNSATRMLPDVPMLLPEANPHHLGLIELQRRRLGTRHGFIAVKPNCSIQSYVPALDALKAFEPLEVAVCTYQAISGAGKTFETWPEMVDNVIPFIKGEEEKSEQEPRKIWGTLTPEGLRLADLPRISAQCIRVPVADGHLAAVKVRFKHRPSREQIISAWQAYRGRPQELGLASAPARALTWFEEDNRPQTRLDRDLHGGMGISVGRLQEDPIFDWRFVGLSHNTVRGAAGGAVLMAELLKAEGYLVSC